jgi:hypothetical protein
VGNNWGQVNSERFNVADNLNIENTYFAIIKRACRMTALFLIVYTDYSNPLDQIPHFPYIYATFRHIEISSIKHILSGGQYDQKNPINRDGDVAITIYCMF